MPLKYYWLDKVRGEGKGGEKLGDKRKRKNKLGDPEGKEMSL